MLLSWLMVFTRFILEEEGRYRISARLTQAPDYGIIQLYLDERPFGTEFNGYYAEGVRAVEVDLSSRVINAGEHILTVKILGADANAKPGNMAGIDWVKFE